MQNWWTDNSTNCECWDYSGARVATDDQDKTCALNYSQNMRRHTDTRAHMGADINFLTNTSARAMENN